MLFLEEKSIEKELEVYFKHLTIDKPIFGPSGYTPVHLIMDNDISINTIILTNIITSTARILSNDNILPINNNCLNLGIKIILL
jgi:hypothetical protein